MPTYNTSAEQPKSQPPPARLSKTRQESVRFLLASLLGCVALWQARGQPAPDPMADGFRLRGGVISLYGSTELEPTTVVRFDQAYQDYETRGFFRIGVLPMLVMEGVTFELPHPESATNTLAQLHQWLQSKAARRLELRRVSFLVSGPVPTRLETGRARLAANGTLSLLDGVSFVSGTNQLKAPRGVLQITGEQPGQLVMENSPPWTNNLFGRLAPLKP